MEQQLSQREKLLKADMKAQGRPKSTIYAIGANLIGAGANKVRRWETMINRPKTNDEGNKTEVNKVHPVSWIPTTLCASFLPLVLIRCGPRF